MRIDPSQLSEPLAHVLGVQRNDAADGGRTASQAAALKAEQQLEQLDVSLLERMRAAAAADAANSVVSFHDAQQRLDRIRELAADPAATRGAQGSLDAGRVRGLLEG